MKKITVTANENTTAKQSGSHSHFPEIKKIAVWDAFKQLVGWDAAIQENQNFQTAETYWLADGSGRRPLENWWRTQPILDADELVEKSLLESWYPVMYELRQEIGEFAVIILCERSVNAPAVLRSSPATAEQYLVAMSFDGATAVVSEELIARRHRVEREQSEANRPALVEALKKYAR